MNRVQKSKLTPRIEKHFYQTSGNEQRGRYAHVSNKFDVARNFDLDGVSCVTDLTWEQPDPCSQSSGKLFFPDFIGPVHPLDTPW